MPRNGSGVYSPPAGTTAVVNTVISPDEFNNYVSDMTADANNARPINAGGTGATNASGARTNLGVYAKSETYAKTETDAKVVYASKSGDYTALATDNNAIHRFTGTATLFLTEAATLGSDWHYVVFADGGDVTIDPNGSETIDGSATLVISDGHFALIVCDGTVFYTDKTNARLNEKLEEPITPGNYQSLSGLTEIDFTIPAGKNFIVLAMDTVSSNGTNYLAVQLGTSAGPRTTGYLGNGLVYVSGATNTGSAPSDKFQVSHSFASNLFSLSGSVRLYRAGANSNTWIIDSSSFDTVGSRGWKGDGIVTLPGEITTVRFSANGNTFDAGAATILF